MIESANIRDSYKMYIAKVTAANMQREGEDILKRLPVKEYIYIVNGFMQFLMKKVFAGKTIKLPCNMGTLCIVGVKVKPRLDERGNIKGLSPSWAKTKKLWERDAKAKEEKEIVYCFNEHSKGFRFRFLWSRRTAVFKNKTVYSLKMSRANKRVVYKMAYQGAEFLEVKPRFYGNK